MLTISSKTQLNIYHLPKHVFQFHSNIFICYLYIFHHPYICSKDLLWQQAKNTSFSFEICVTAVVSTQKLYFSKLKSLLCYDYIPSQYCCTKIFVLKNYRKVFIYNCEYESKSFPKEWSNRFFMNLYDIFDHFISSGLGIAYWFKLKDIH